MHDDHLSPYKNIDFFLDKKIEPKKEKIKIENVLLILPIIHPNLFLISLLNE